MIGTVIPVSYTHLDVYKRQELFYTVQIGLDGFTAASERFKTKAAAEAVKQLSLIHI